MEYMLLLIKHNKANEFGIIYIIISKVRGTFIGIFRPSNFNGTLEIFEA